MGSLVARHARCWAGDLARRQRLRATRPSAARHCEPTAVRVDGELVGVADEPARTWSWRGVLPVVQVGHPVALAESLRAQGIVLQGIIRREVTRACGLLKALSVKVQCSTGELDH